MSERKTASILRLSGRTLDLEQPVVMGILNASPDSFSEARPLSHDELFKKGLQMLEDGATILDIGGESAVTNRPPVPAGVEIERVCPLVERFVKETDAIVSVDTYKREVAAAAIEQGAVMVNDVSGLRDPEMARTCAEANVALVLMHTTVEPKKKLSNPRYEHLVDDVIDFLQNKIEIALDMGMSEDQLVVDPGPDFAKTPSQSVGVLRELAQLQVLGRPILLAVSRKDFIGALTWRMPNDRLAGTLAGLACGVASGASILRVHDVRESCDFLRIWFVLNGDVDVPEALKIPEEIRRQHSVTDPN